MIVVLVLICNAYLIALLIFDLIMIIGAIETNDTKGEADGFLSIMIALNALGVACVIVTSYIALFTGGTVCPVP